MIRSWITRKVSERSLANSLLTAGVVSPRESNDNDLRKMLAESYAYINMSRSRYYPINFIKAGLSGCMCFVWSYHPFADEYPVHRFENADDAVPLIQAVFEKTGETANADIRASMMDWHSPPKFHENLQNIVKKIIFP